MGSVLCHLWWRSGTTSFISNCRTLSSQDFGPFCGLQGSRQPQTARPVTVPEMHLPVCMICLHWPDVFYVCMFVVVGGWMSWWVGGRGCMHMWMASLASWLLISGPCMLVRGCRIAVCQCVKFLWALLRGYVWDEARVFRSKAQAGAPQSSRGTRAIGGMPHSPSSTPPPPSQVFCTEREIKFFLSTAEFGPCHLTHVESCTMQVQPPPPHTHTERLKICCLFVFVPPVRRQTKA